MRFICDDQVFEGTVLAGALQYYSMKLHFGLVEERLYYGISFLNWRRNKLSAWFDTEAHLFLLSLYICSSLAWSGQVFCRKQLVCIPLSSAFWVVRFFVVGRYLELLINVCGIGWFVARKVVLIEKPQWAPMSSECCDSHFKCFRLFCKVDASECLKFQRLLSLGYFNSVLLVKLEVMVARWLFLRGARRLSIRNFLVVSMLPKYDGV